jgi:hypothetical protein
MRNRLAFSTVRRRVARAVRQFLLVDGDLLTRDVAEITLSHRFATFLSAEFPGRHVDVNYNRHGWVIKRLQLPAVCQNSRKSRRRVLPDVVVHLRGKDDANLLVVEMKKSTNVEPRDCDLARLRCFCQQLRYQYGLFIEFRAGTPTPGVVRKEWQGAQISKPSKA